MQPNVNSPGIQLLLAAVCLKVFTEQIQQTILRYGSQRLCGFAIAKPRRRGIRMTTKGAFNGIFRRNVALLRKVPSDKLCFSVSRISCEVFKVHGFSQGGTGWPDLEVGIQVSHEKNPYYFPLSWLVNKDPYNGLL